MHHSVSFGLAVATSLALTAGFNSAASAQDYFAGKTVTLVYNATPGGTTNLGAQTFINHWAKHIPGNPTMIAQSMPGGNLSQGINYVLNAKPDGLTLGWLAWNGSTRVLDPPELQIPFDRFEVIGGGGFGAVVHARKDIGGGLDDPMNFMKADKVVYGGYRPAGGYDTRMRLSLELLELDYSYVSGFGGGAPALAAMLRDEINVHTPSLADYISNYKKNVIADGQTAALWYWGRPKPDGTTEKKPAVPELMTFEEVYTKAKGKAPSGPKYDAIMFLSATADSMTWLIPAPPETPDEIMAILRKSFEETTTDPEFIAEMTKQTQSMPDLVLWEDATKVVEQVKSIAPEIRSVLEDSIARASK